MCFHVDPEFVKVRRVKADNSSLDTRPTISDEMHTNRGEPPLHHVDYSYHQVDSLHIVGLLLKIERDH
jgi:hypothetical protein